MANLFRCGSGGGIKSITIPKFRYSFRSIDYGAGADRNLHVNSGLRFDVPNEVKRLSVESITPASVTINVYGKVKGSSGNSNIIRGVNTVNNLDVSNYTDVYIDTSGLSNNTTQSELEGELQLNNITLEF